ncbi:winged helix-turn-helix domain-containing protein [Saccharothrix xinjiangensis]|uniref:ArsR/SmtB family transcription factor n=1 Tax=Saccharothrix xinjiangensis TaxID=204798 RepID=A0ABV9Y2F6_9PSEU
MQRIHFNAEDLARIHVVSTLGHEAEAVFALGMIARGAAAHFGPWHHRLAVHLGAHHDAVQGAARSVRIADLVRLVGDAAGTARTGAARDVLPAVVRELDRRAIQPYWPGISAYLAGERDAHGRTLLAGGVASLLATLHPAIRWCPPVLEVPSDDDEDVELGGAGIVLAPSLFLTGRPAVLVGPLSCDGQVALAFSATPTADAAAGLWGTRALVRESLGPLVGRTRARLLRETRTGCTTGELAQLLGISPACVSQHTGVLREARLITTRRHRNTVVHCITTLGIALLGEDFASPPPVPVGQRVSQLP